MPVDISLILNRAQQKLANHSYAALLHRREHGCVPDESIIVLAKLNAIIDALSWNPSKLTFEQLEDYSEAVNRLGGYDELPYKDLNLAFFNTSILYQSSGGGASTWGQLQNKPAAFPTTIPLVNGLGSQLSNITERIDDLEAAIEDVSGAEPVYTNPNPTNVAVGAAPIGSVLDGLSLQDIIDITYYAVLSPQVISFAASGSTREFTASTTDTTTVSYTVRRRTSPIISVVITDSFGNTYPQTLDATANATDGGAWSGTQEVPLNENNNNNISITVTTADGSNNTASASASVVYRHYRFWFTSDTDLAGASDAAISAVLNALPSGNKEFATNRDMPVRAFTGTPQAPKYVYTAYLSTYGTASYVVNAAANNAWTTFSRNYTNASGYTAAFRLNQFNDQISGTANIDQN